MMRKVFATLLVSLIGLTAAAAAELPQYQVLRTTGKITIDGVLNEADWAAAKTAGDFVFPWWTEGEKEQTRVRMLWDDQFLYISYDCDDKHIWADHFSTNEDTYKDDCVELFWNPDPKAGKMYNMFEINCLGNLLSVYNNFQRSIKLRESRILPPHIGQTIRGTVNNDADTDSGWTLEIAVRFADYPELFNARTPKDGDMWRAGLNRCGGKTNPQNSQWSPSQTPTHNFHRPDDFGEVYFVNRPAR